MDIDMSVTYRELLESKLCQTLGVTFEIARQIANDCISNGCEIKDFKKVLGDIPKNVSFESWDMEVPKTKEQYLRLFEHMWEPFEDDVNNGFVTKKQAIRKYFTDATYQDVVAYYLYHYQESTYVELAHLVTTGRWCPKELLSATLRELRAICYNDTFTDSNIPKDLFA